MENVARGSDGRRLFTAELERLVGRQTLELEILRVARDEVKSRPHFYGVSGKRSEGRSR
jgi:hypothetical protein